MPRMLLSVLILSAGLLEAGGSDERIDTLRAAYSKWNEAQARADVAAMARMSTEDFSCVSYGGHNLNRTEWMRYFEHMTPAARTALADRRSEEKQELLSMRLYGDTGVLLVRTGPKSRWLATAVWVMRNGEWKLAGCHGSVMAASDSFLIQHLAGTWKEDVSKRKTGAGPNLRFRRSANGGIEELRGPEIKPAVQAVILDGRPHPVPGATYSYAWRQIDANYYQRENFGEGQRLLYTRHLRLAPDGKTLTEEGVRAIDGLRSVSVYRRIDGAPHGLTGTWARESTQGQPAAEMTIEHARANAIRISGNWTPTFTLTLGGPPVPFTGEMKSGQVVISKMSVQARQLDDHAIEIVRSRDGTAVSKSEVRVSADGKTMTFTVSELGSGGPRGEPAVYVYRKH